MATKSKKRLTGPARRDTILAAAISQFAQAGYERTRVADIAGTVGVTEPVIFQNFGTKADLFAAVLERVSGDLLRYLRSVHAAGRHTAEVVAMLLEHEHQDRLHSHAGVGLILADAAERSEPSIRQAIRRAHSRAIEAVAVLLRQGQSEGTIRQDVDALTLAGLVLSQIQARHFRHHHSETSAVLERDLRTAVLAALRPHPRILSRGTRPGA